jgi:hypothetical protein
VARQESTRPATRQECKAADVRRLSLIINAGENPVAWSYEIRGSNNVVAATANGLTGGGVATVRAGQDSDVLVPRK